MAARDCREVFYCCERYFEDKDLGGNVCTVCILSSKVNVLSWTVSMFLVNVAVAVPNGSSSAEMDRA